MSEIVEKIRNELKLQANSKTKLSFQRFFKEKVKFYGLKSADVTKIAKNNFLKIKDLPKDKIFYFCEELLKSGYCEETWIAANWTYCLHKSFTPTDFKVFERWIEKYIDNWAECDTFCNHTVGSFIEKYPKYLKQLKIWAKSKNLWLRRAAAVSLILSARSGKFLKEILEIADILLKDREDIVQKGYGWMLKEASRTHQKEIFNYVMKNKKVMPRTSLRYAVEKMPENLKRQAMNK